MRQEADEVEFPRWQAAGGQRSNQRCRTGHRFDPQPGFERRSDHTFTRVANAGAAGISNQRDFFAGAQPGKDFLAPSGFIELKIADEGFGDFEMFEELACPACVFSRDQIAFLKSAQRAKRDILEVANWCRDQIKRTGRKWRRSGSHRRESRRGQRPAHQNSTQLTCHSALTVCSFAAVFTGIVEETGKVAGIRPASDSIALSVQMRVCGRGLKRGESLAVNGCCLTVAAVSRRTGHTLARFDLLKETWDRTNLKFTKPGSLVNLERPLAADGRLGGHFVTGHIDGTGVIIASERIGKDRVLDIEAPADVQTYLIPKGSIAIDGISLTVAEVSSKGFRVWIIPHTWQATVLRERKQGDAVNLEADLLGKYVKQFISSGSKF